MIKNLMGVAYSLSHAQWRSNIKSDSVIVS